MKRVLLLLLLVFSSNAYSAITVYQFDTLAEEKRFKHLNTILRCPKCQNQSLADSNSQISEDLKAIVYEKMQSGYSDQQILDFMKQRYGEFILYEPEVSQSNWFLWLGPFIFLVIFLISFFVWFNRHRSENDND